MKRALLLFITALFFGAALSSSAMDIPASGHPKHLIYPPLKFELSRAQRIVLENGIILYFLEDHQLPLVNITAMIRTGSVYDPEGKEGLAEMTGKVMRTGGTMTMVGDEVDDALEQFAGVINISMAADTCTASLSSLKKDMEAGVGIFSQILREPAFEEKKLLLSKNLKIEEIRRITDHPQRFAMREFYRILYRNHPRGKTATLASVKGIGRDDLVRFHSRYFHPSNTMIAVSGALNREEAVNLVLKYFGTWKTEGTRVDRPPAWKKEKGGIYFISKDVPQSVILLGHRAPGKKDGDAYPFSVFDFIIGSGGFSSRIFQEIRTDRGLAYSAGSFYGGRGNDGIFGAYAITKASSTAETLALLQSIMRDASSKGVSAKELSWAKKSIENGFIFSFQSAEQIATQQMGIEYDQLPEDYLVTYRKKIERVRADDALRVIRKYLADDDFVVLVLGNEEAFRQLRAMTVDLNRIEGSL